VYLKNKLKMDTHNAYQNVFQSKAIVPPPKDLTNKFKVKHVLIDSRDRNKNQYESPSKYAIEFNESFQNVSSIEMTVSNFPFNEYNVTQYNNTLIINDILYSISPGKYTPTLLIEQLNNFISDIVFSYDSITEKISIQNNTISEISFKCKSDTPKRFDSPNDVYVYTYEENSIAQLLGLNIENFEINANDTFEFPYPINLNAQSNYIVMYIQRAKLNMSQNNTLHDSFAIIRPKHDNLTTYGDEIKVKKFNPPIDIKKIQFSFYDYYGNLYDFQNKEHSFELKVTYYKHAVKYNNIFSQII
jgi:hypothetical protein